MPIIVEPNAALNYLQDHPNIIKGQISSAPGKYVISLKTLSGFWYDVKASLDNGSTVAIEKTDEGIETLWHIIQNERYAPWIKSHKLRFLTCSDSDTDIANLNSEHFLNATIGSQQDLKITYGNQRPYTFLFTNKKIRPHRRYLILELQRRGLLDNALWTCLHQFNTWGHKDLTQIYEPGDSMPFKAMEPNYDPKDLPSWFEGVVYPRHFEDTWFTLVSETGFEYPHSFRTEKVWKPILAGHPFIVCSNVGFYRDLKNLGFKTFGHLISEKFDSIIDGKHRLDALINEVKWLCSQDLPAFWQASADVRLYNQQHAHELHNSQQTTFTKKLLDFMHA